MEYTVQLKWQWSSKTDMFGAKCLSPTVHHKSHVDWPGFNLGLQSKKHTERDTDWCKGLVARKPMYWWTIYEAERLRDLVARQPTYSANTQGKRQTDR